MLQSDFHWVIRKMEHVPFCTARGTFWDDFYDINKESLVLLLGLNLLWVSVNTFCSLAQHEADLTGFTKLEKGISNPQFDENHFYANKLKFLILNIFLKFCFCDEICLLVKMEKKKLI